MKIAQHLARYDATIIQELIGYSSMQVIQWFHYFCAMYHTMNDDNIALTLPDKVSTLFFSKWITNRGICRISETLLNFAKSAHANLENWEDFLEIDLPSNNDDNYSLTMNSWLDPRLEIQKIVLHQTSITSHTMSLLAHCFPKITSLVFVNTPLSLIETSIDSETDFLSSSTTSLSSKPDHFLLTPFLHLEELIFVECRWLTYEFFQSYLQHRSDIRWDHSLPSQRWKIIFLPSSCSSSSSISNDIFPNKKKKTSSFILSNRSISSSKLKTHRISLISKKLGPLTKNEEQLLIQQFSQSGIELIFEYNINLINHDITQMH
jgi:hypothetical protein